MTVLLTNGTGHLGANLVRALVSDGRRVRVLVRPGSSAEALEGLPVERVPGDVTDRASLDRAVAGATHVFHVAAFVSLRARDQQRLFETNVLGTRNVLAACTGARVERVVHTSSFGTIGDSDDGASSEEDVRNPFDPMMDYDRSKLAAEAEVLRAAARGLRVCMVNPTGIVGPWDFKPSHLGRTILDFAQGRLPALIPGAFDFVPMRDVVAGHLLAAERGRAGERYLLSGEVVTVDRMFDWLTELTGARKPRLRIPPSLLLPPTRAKDWVERRLLPSRSPLFNEHSIRLLTSGRHGTNDKARRELGLTPSPIREAFADAVAWFRSHGSI